MFTHFQNVSKVEKIERWKQCQRVLEGLTFFQRLFLFDERGWKEQRWYGTVRSLAAYCAIDPWFIAQGYTEAMLKSASTMAFFGMDAVIIFRNFNHIGELGAQIEEHINEIEFSENSNGFSNL